MSNLANNKSRISPFFTISGVIDVAFSFLANSSIASNVSSSLLARLNSRNCCSFSAFFALNCFIFSVSGIFNELTVFSSPFNSLSISAILFSKVLSIIFSADFILLASSSSLTGNFFIPSRIFRKSARSSSVNSSLWIPLLAGNISLSISSNADNTLPLLFILRIALSVGSSLNLETLPYPVIASRISRSVLSG